MQETIDAILRAAVEEGSWEDAVDRVCFEIGAPAAVLFMSDDLQMRSKVSVLSEFWRHPSRTVATETFATDVDVSADAAAYQLFKNLRPRTLVREVDIFGLASPDDLPRSVVRDITFSFGFSQRVASVLNTNGPWIDALTLQIHDYNLKSEEFQVLASTLSSAMRMRHMLRDARRNAVIASEALNRMPIGVFALTDDGSVAFCNSEAGRQFSEVEQVEKRGGVVCFSGISENLGVGAVDTSSVPIRGAVIERLAIQAFVLASNDNRMPMIGQIERTAGLYDDTVWLVFTFDLEKIRSHDASFLGKLAGLTDAETDVLGLLAQGNSVREIASKRGTSRITTRNQLKSIMEKLRCSSQKDLVALSASTSLARLE